jgi:hypothetical protein
MRLAIYPADVVPADRAIPAQPAQPQLQFLWVHEVLDHAERAAITQPPLDYLIQARDIGLFPAFIDVLVDNVDDLPAVCALRTLAFLLDAARLAAALRPPDRTGTGALAEGAAGRRATPPCGRRSRRHGGHRAPHVPMLVW